MKKKIIFVLTLLISILFISACSNSAEDEKASETPDAEETTSPSLENEDKAGNDNNDNSMVNFDLPEDQMGLSMGDTAHYMYGYQDDSREFEITLNSVEIADTLGGEPSQEGTYVLVDVTLKNLSDVPVKAEEGLGIGLGNENAGSFPWFYLEGVAEEWPGEIQPNESQTGVLLYDLPAGNSYELIGGEHHSNANTISFEFTADEAE
ncbi:DUF4352 domain-containing protein [Oceanobacillus damuensis]|uniref:DUF4352 domain-containing protein n=1 Tax=Oceanobacillus damuensis TaxID=937928 RepID=UPI00082999EC|nr:DUF4352 domain-containing protein [Oceanobacillus damuensis]